jgi:hypothetical protein
LIARTFFGDLARPQPTIDKILLTFTVHARQINPFLKLTAASIRPDPVLNPERKQKKTIPAKRPELNLGVDLVCFFKRFVATEKNEKQKKVSNRFFENYVSGFFSKNREDPPIKIACFQNA